MIKKPGRQPSIMEAYVIKQMFSDVFPDDEIIIHHITEDSPTRLQVEYEVRTRYQGKTKCLFLRDVINGQLDSLGS